MSLLMILLLVLNGVLGALQANTVYEQLSDLNSKVAIFMLIAHVFFVGFVIGWSTL